MRMQWLCLASLTVTAVEAEVFDVTKHGAKGDGKTRDDGAIEATFRACAATASGAGTGTGSREVLFPAPGTYITGPWELACNNSVVTIEPGASVVSFTANGSTQGWPIGALTSPEPSQGLTDKQAAPFILSHYARNVTLRGGGTLDAGGRPFWHEHCGNWWCPKWAGPGVTPKSPYAWRPFMLRIDHSTDITIEGLRFEATAFWCIVPVHSEHIEIANLVIHARDSADSGTPNTDGIEPMWSKDVHIHDVSINNGDVSPVHSTVYTTLSTHVQNSAPSTSRIYWPRDGTTSPRTGCTDGSLLTGLHSPLLARVCCVPALRCLRAGLRDGQVREQRYRGGAPRLHQLSRHYHRLDLV